VDFEFISENICSLVGRFHLKNESVMICTLGVSSSVLNGNASVERASIDELHITSSNREDPSHGIQNFDVLYEQTPGSLD
jgi:hypothetical protein